MSTENGGSIELTELKGKALATALESEAARPSRDLSDTVPHRFRLAGGAPFTPGASKLMQVDWPDSPIAL